MLLVVSAFSTEPLAPGKRVLEMLVGNPQMSAPLARARRVRARVRPAGGRGTPGRTSVVDITPTILDFLGLPVARDMEGFPRTDIFKPSFTSERPVTYIPSYGR